MKIPFIVHWKNIVSILLSICSISLVLAVSGCGDDYSSSYDENDLSNTGSYTCSIKWPEDVPTLESKSALPRAIDCDAAGVVTVAFTFYDGSGSYLTGDEWSCSLHEGTVYGIPRGTDRRLVVTGEDASGTVLYRGEETGIEIVAGQTTQGREIEMDRVDGAAFTYNSSGSLGELLTYTIDTTAMTYSYEIVESQFGLQGISDSGSLILNQDGTYSPYDNPDIRLILLPNTLIVGGADITVGDADTFMLFAGVPALDTDYTPAEIACTYNYIVFECDDPLSGGICTSGYRSYYGTFEICEDCTWKTCGEGDLGDVESNPCSGVPMSGNWTDEGDGIISITYGGTEIGKAMLLPSGAGGKVMIIDFKDRQDAGPGILIGVKQQDISGEDLSGKYHYNSDDGGYGDVEVDNVANTYLGSYTEPDGSQQTTSGSLHRNFPWEGWLTADNNTPATATDDDIILILPGDGVFLQTSPSSTRNDWINVGGKIP